MLIVMFVFSPGIPLSSFFPLPSLWIFHKSLVCRSHSFWGSSLSVVLLSVGLIAASPFPTVAAALPWLREIRDWVSTRSKELYACCLFRELLALRILIPCWCLVLCP
ncbi:hypothetical protein MtrunA17_Chr4g0002681 [Medicago truncatula]|uniref:Transmembrane protein n=1 Tax=Medicago truncatula TaxID=3880 RepID=A0A396HYR6_MEDTR|nr:hypothetical protein MtrunA17_Chr4g0002681 [Medicago truncatula]